MITHLIHRTCHYAGMTIICFALFTSHANTAYAEGISLSTYPSTIHLKAQPPADVRSGFTIINKNAETIKLKILLKPFKEETGRDGKLMYLEGTNPEILKRVHVVDNGFAVSSIELSPKQSKNLTLRIEMNEKEKPADYYFSIIFLTEQPLQEETTKETTARLNIQAGIAINVLMNIGPKELPRGYLEEFSTPSFRTSGPVPFTVKVQNKGTHYFTPKGVILIKNIFGQTVGRIDLQNANILAGTSRSLVGTPYQSVAKKDSIDSSVKENSTTDQISTSGYSSQGVVWPEKFLLGVYKADVSIALSEEGPLFTQTVSFIALPANILIGLGITGMLLFLIILRVRRQIRES